MKHFVVQETRRYDFEAKSMKDAKKKFAQEKVDIQSLHSSIEETVIVCQETGEEEYL